MPLFKQTAIATLLFLSFTGAASAINLDSIPGVTGTSISVSVNDGVATLFGQTDSALEREMTERYVAKLEGVDRVINLISHK